MLFICEDKIFSDQITEFNRSINYIYQKSDTNICQLQERICKTNLNKTQIDLLTLERS